MHTTGAQAGAGQCGKTRSNSIGTIGHAPFFPNDFTDDYVEIAIAEAVHTFNALPIPSGYGMAQAAYFSRTRTSYLGRPS